MVSLPVKKNILNVKRISNQEESRLPYLRLDKNENTVGFDKDMLEIFKNQITSDFLTSYPEVPSLYKKIADFLNIRRENIYVTSGSDAAIKAVFEVFMEKGDGVALLHPTYAMYYVYADIFESNLIKINYRKDLFLTAEDVIEVVARQKPKLVCLANPNSPTGTIIPPEGIKKIVDFCSLQNTIVLLDEAYYPFYPVSSIDLIRDYPNLVITRTFSKATGLAAARLGFAIGHESMIECLQKVRPLYETNAFAVRFAELALDNYKIVEKNLEEIGSGKEYLYNELDKLKIPYYQSYANFVLIDVGSFEKSVAIGKALYLQKILIKSGFKDGLLDNCIRVSVGTPGQMEIFMKAFKKSLINQ